MYQEMATVEIPLAQRLKDETAGVHSQAENSDFMARLLAGKLGTQDVINLTAQLYFVYEALEPAIRANSESAQVKAVFDQRLERLSALDADLRHLIGQSWQATVAPLPATVNYIERLRQIAQIGNANAALAHHYVRYLGDLSGGQVIAAMLGKHYGIGAEGISFYDFKAIGKIKPYRDAYRARISDLDISQADKDAVVQEAKNAFCLNRGIFAALG